MAFDLNMSKVPPYCFYFFITTGGRRELAGHLMVSANRQSSNKGQLVSQTKRMTIVDKTYSKILL